MLFSVDEEVKVSPKLSDANMGGSAASLISEGSEVGYEKSTGCHTPPPSKNSRPGIEVSSSPKIIKVWPIILLKLSGIINHILHSK